MSSDQEKNKVLVRRLGGEAQGDLNVIDEVLNRRFVDHDRLPGQAPDREGYKRRSPMHHAASPTSVSFVEDQVAEETRS